MNTDIARLLAPYTDAVQNAQAELDRANRAPNALSATYATAGRLIAAYAAYTTALVDIIDRRDPGKAECGCEDQMRIHGRLRALAEVQEQ